MAGKVDHLKFVDQGLNAVLLSARLATGPHYYVVALVKVTELERARVNDNLDGVVNAFSDEIHRAIGTPPAKAALREWLEGSPWRTPDERCNHYS